MSRNKHKRRNNFQQPSNIVTTNSIAAALRAQLPRDHAPRTLPRTLPGCSLTADGEFIPEDQRTPQIFEDGLDIAVCNVVAAELQKYNTQNRNRSKVNVQKLLAAMRCGEWMYNGKSSVLVCSHSAILDSQHTLEATRLYFEDTDNEQIKKPFLMRVEMGLTPEVFSTLDTGAKRTLADTLHVESAAGNINYGSVSDRMMAQSQRLLLQYLNSVHDLPPSDINYLPGERAGIVNTRAALILNMYPQLIDSAAFVCSVKGLRDVVRPFIPAVAHMLITEAQSKTAADNFVRSLATGSDLPEGSPILALRSLYIKAHARDRRMEGPEALAYFMHAWNKFADGKTVDPGRLKSFGPEGKIPVPKAIARQRASAAVNA